MGGKKPPKPPTLPPPPPVVAPRKVPYSETFGEFLGQEAQIPSLESFATGLNERFRQQLETGLPGTMGAARQISTLVNQLLSGAVPQAAQAETQRALAQRGIETGLLGTSEAQKFEEAKTLGSTALTLQQQGAAYLPGLMQLSASLSPQQVQNYLFSTGQIRGDELRQVAEEANAANATAANQYRVDTQNMINKYNYDVSTAQRQSGLFGGLGGLFGGVAGAALGSVVPGIGTLAGASLGSAFGGSLGSFASGGAFAPTTGAGGFGGLIGNAFPGEAFRGLVQGTGGTTTVAPSQSYFSPFISSSMNPVSNFLTPQNRGTYGGQYPISVGGLSF